MNAELRNRTYDAGLGTVTYVVVSAGAFAADAELVAAHIGKEIPAQLDIDIDALRIVVLVEHHEGVVDLLRTVKDPDVVEVKIRRSESDEGEQNGEEHHG